MPRHYFLILRKARGTCKFAFVTHPNCFHTGSVILQPYRHDIAFGMVQNTIGG